MTTTSSRRADALRRWARGDRALEAAVALLIKSLDGRLLDGPWVRPVGSRRWFDPACAYAESGALSGGERRVLAVATSLASPDHPVDLGDAITGMDPATVWVALRALAHAGGVDTEEAT